MVSPKHIPERRSGLFWLKLTTDYHNTSSPSCLYPRAAPCLISHMATARPCKTSINKAAAAAAATGTVNDSAEQSEAFQTMTAVTTSSTPRSDFTRSLVHSFNGTQSVSHTFGHLLSLYIISTLATLYLVDVSVA